MTAPSTLRKGFLFKLHACYQTWKKCKDAIFNGLHCANYFYHVVSAKDFYGPEFWCTWVVHWQKHIHAWGYFEFSQVSCLIKSTENIRNYFTLDPVTFRAKCFGQSRTQWSDWSVSTAKTPGCGFIPCGFARSVAGTLELCSRTRHTRHVVPTRWGISPLHLGYV